MKWLIYTCPIAVMWMMKHHGIRFQWRPVGKGFWHDVKFPFLDGDHEYRVHPDDVVKYELIDGDEGMLQFKKFDKMWKYVKIENGVTMFHSHHGNYSPFYLEPDEASCFTHRLRNNIPWINPCEVRGV